MSLFLSPHEIPPTHLSTSLRSTPRELYYDIVEELEVKYEADKTTIEEALAAKVLDLKID